MATLVWNQVGDRKYESGVDRGVLYLEDGSGIAWNGLISVNEKTAVTVEPLYLDGRKFNEKITLGEYAATLSAFTYPDEFAQFEGVEDIGNGISMYNQRLSRFGLSYRTKIGNDVDGLTAGYKIHVLYNLLAVPTDTIFDSLSVTPEAIAFQWELTSIPVDLSDYEPTAHLVIDSTKTPPDFIYQVEEILYGTVSTSPRLPSFSYLVNLALTDLV